MNIKWEEYGIKQCDSVFDFVNTGLSSSYDLGKVEILECEVENNRKAIATLCSILADKTTLTASDIVKIVDEVEYDHELTFEEVK